MRAKIVIGLGFGDEGKGITTDYLCKKSPHSTIVVRFSGGQQAGHTVVIDGIKHTYSSFGSGTGRGVPTFISEYCTFYPTNIINEYNVLIDKGLVIPALYIHPLSKLTTPYDVAWGRLREMMYKHGSCGMGVGATMTRHEQSPYRVYMSDLLHPALLGKKLSGIGNYYTEKVKDLLAFPRQWSLEISKHRHVQYYLEQVELEMEGFNKAMLSAYMKFLVAENIIDYDELRRYSTLIFEGSQGIMLDMEHGVFPNVTYSSTTSKNAISLCKELGISRSGINVYYITRCYQTRHGQGWMSSPDSVKLVNNMGEINVTNEWQKEFRTAELDYLLLRYALKIDNAYSYECDKHLVVTCLDQRENFKFNYSEVGNFCSIIESKGEDNVNFMVVET